MTELAIGIVCPHCLAKPAAKLVTGHWWQGTWGQVALTHADTISTQYLHKFIAKFCRHIYQILSIIYYLHTLCSRGAPGLRQVTWWCVLWLPPAAPRHAPSPANPVFHKTWGLRGRGRGRARLAGVTIPAAISYINRYRRHIPCFTLYQGTPGPMVRYLHKSIKLITNFDAHTIPIQ